MKNLILKACVVGGVLVSVSSYGADIKTLNCGAEPQIIPLKNFSTEGSLFLFSAVGESKVKGSDKFIFFKDFKIRFSGGKFNIYNADNNAFVGSVNKSEGRAFSIKNSESVEFFNDKPAQLRADLFKKEFMSRPKFVKSVRFKFASENPMSKDQFPKDQIHIEEDGVQTLVISACANSQETEVHKNFGGVPQEPFSSTVPGRSNKKTKSVGRGQ